MANRTFDVATRVARRLDARAVRLPELDAELRAADVLLSSTGAAAVLLGRDQVADVMDARAGRPLLVVDIAVPRDVDPAVGALPGVTLLDMDDVSGFVDAGLAERRRAVDTVAAILAEELDRYLERASARAVAPTIVGLRSAADAVLADELARHDASLAALGARERATVEAVTRGVVAKLLHQPTVALKDAAGTPKGERLVQALHDLFDLDD